MRLRVYTYNPLSENTYLLFDDTKEGILVDPGCCTLEEEEDLLVAIQREGVKVVGIYNTHSHIDHVLGVDVMQRRLKVPFYVHKIDEETLFAVPTYAPMYGFPNFREPEVDGYIKEGTPIKFGNTELEVLFVPGHAPGHVAFLHVESLTLIAGDVLFKRSIGRYDLPGGDVDTLLASIKEKFFALPDETSVHPGHGPPTTIGEEKLHNPFVGKNARA